MTTCSTFGVSEERAFEHWHEVICRHFVPADSSLEDRAAFYARFQTNALGTVQVSRLSAARHAWSRSPAHVRSTPHDEFLLSLKVSGDSCLEQAGRQVRQRPGEMALYDTGQPFSYFLGCDVVLLKIPRRELLARVPAALRFTAVGFGRESSVGMLAAGLMRQSLDVDLSTNAAAAARLGSSLLDAAAAAIEWELSAHEPRQPRQAALLNTIKRFILANLPDRSLTAEAIADKHHISGRTLNRLFAREGTTPMRWIWDQRLQACYRVLSAAGPKQVTVVALTFGFADLSHFCRAFKAKFGSSPGAVARQRERS
ncbi:MAG: helix-turn-helix domain-containing protein [Gammaproteobacteria bacterium]|nr:helix-turn-helix domain-containing protein [Gammaproteobacteria bacterium]